MTGRLVVLDDDPTGTQSVAGVPVILDWSDSALTPAEELGDTVYMLTNSRALEARDAYLRVCSAVQAALKFEDSAPQFVLRGDSTLRGHVHEEYRGVVDSTSVAHVPPYVLVPAMPSAGRVTIDGVHQLIRNGFSQRLDATEYALDPVFGYRNSELLAWAEERSGGYFPASHGLNLSLATLRNTGPDAVAAAIGRLAEGGVPAAFAPDVETDTDLAIIADGVRLATEQGAVPVVRSGPTLAAIMSGRHATALHPTPKGLGTLILCGSHVPTTTRQLAVFSQRHPGAVIETRLECLDSDAADDEIRRLAAFADDQLTRTGVAAVATPRSLDTGRSQLSSSRRIAENLARVIKATTVHPTTVIAKGGITSAVVARVGFDASVATAVGPVAPGISLWQIPNETGTPRNLIVFPGNIGSDSALADLVAAQHEV